MNKFIRMVLVASLVSLAVFLIAKAACAESIVMKYHGEPKSVQMEIADANYYQHRMDKAASYNIEEIKRRHDLKARQLEVERLWLLERAKAPINQVFLRHDTNVVNVANTGTVSRNKVKFD